jgi:hypothetical protein
MDEGDTLSIEKMIQGAGVSYAGFGLVYEKFVFSEIALRFVHELGLKTICEYPANNLMGNNSDVFQGCEITRASDATKLAGKFDLVWNFCEFEQARDPVRLIETAIELSERFVLIVTQNRRNLGVMIHLLYHALRRVPWDHGSVSRMSFKAVKSAIEKSNAEVVETGAFDIPWFILDVYETGRFLRRITFDAGTSLENMKKSTFERWPRWARFWLAHHHYVLFRVLR